MTRQRFKSGWMALNGFLGFIAGAVFGGIAGWYLTVLIFYMAARLGLLAGYTERTAGLAVERNSPWILAGGLIGALAGGLAVGSVLLRSAPKTNRGEEFGQEE